MPIGYGGAGNNDWMIREAEEARRRKEEEEARQNATHDYVRNQARAEYERTRHREAPQADGTTVGAVSTYGGANINTGPQDQWRQQQIDLANRLRGIESGNVMGAGQLGAQRATQNALGAQQAMARMGRGSNAAMAARTAARNTVDVGQRGMAMQGQAAMADQSQARGALTSLMGQGRGQDIGLSTAQAGLTQQANLANMSAENKRVFQQAGLDQATSLSNMQARLTQMGMDDKAAMTYLAMLYGMDENDIKRRIAEDANDMTWGDALKAGGQVAGALGIVSDKRAKKNVKDGRSPIRQALDSMSPRSFEYKDGMGDDAMDMGEPLGAPSGRREELPPMPHPNAPGSPVRAAASRRDYLQRLATERSGQGRMIESMRNRWSKEGRPGAESDQDRMREAMRERWRKEGRPGYQSDARGRASMGRRQLGVMAQDLQKTPAGSSLVRDDGGLKRLDSDRSVSFSLAALAELNDRLNRLEK